MSQYSKCFHSCYKKGDTLTDYQSYIYMNIGKNVIWLFLYVLFLVQAPRPIFWKTFKLKLKIIILYIEQLWCFKAKIVCVLHCTPLCYFCVTHFFVIEVWFDRVLLLRTEKLNIYDICKLCLIQKFFSLCTNKSI